MLGGGAAITSEVKMNSCRVSSPGSMATDYVLGTALRDWRLHRRRSQMQLADDMGVSTRHLSFVENGRARPSRDMLMRLLELLDVPVRERNALLLGAGFAPAYSAAPMGDPSLEAVRAAMRLMLNGLEPNPALAVDRHWNLVDANRPAQQLLAGVAPSLLQGAVNVLRISLHPQGLAPRIANFDEWRAYVLRRLAHDIDRTKDPVLVELRNELSGYEANLKDSQRAGLKEEAGGELPILVPLRLRTPAGELSFLSATTVFGSALNVAVAELAIETFLPANAATREALQRMAKT